MILRCADSNFAEILEIINDAAKVYRGVIPEDRYHEPYMPEKHLRHEIQSGVEFWAEKNRLLRKYWDIPERQVETSVVLKESCGAPSGAPSA